MFSGGKLVALETVRRAVIYYRSTTTKSRPLESITKQFRFIKTKNDLKKLRNFEKDEQACIDRKNQLRILCNEVRQTIFDKMERGITLHDADIQLIAREVNRTLNVPRFNAELRWVQKFKKASRITSRHITRIVSRKSLQKRSTTEANARHFVEEIRSLNFEPALIVNADQSGKI